MQSPYRFERFELRAAERLLIADGAPTLVGARAFDLLVCLVERRDRVVTKRELLDAVWPGLVVEENNLSVQVSTLRKLLGAGAIATVPGRGYRFTLPVRQSEPPATDTVPAPPRDLASIPPPSPPIPDPTTVAVLPFAVLADDPRIAFLAAGLTEDVIALLARVPGFVLISHASSSTFRAGSTGLTEVARALGVRFVVEGSVRPVGDAVRVSTQLSDAASARVLWSSRFDSRPDAALDLQESIARGVIAELEPELTRAEIAHIRRQRPENLDAWARYRQAVGAIALRGWTEEALAEARAHLRDSVVLDPSFGLGHAHYALLTALAKNVGLLADPAAADDALGAANRAIALDDGSSEVLGYAGCALCDLGDRERGVEVVRRALAIDPSNAQAQVALGAAMVMSGALDEGIATMRHGMRISPRDRRLGFWRWALGQFLFRAERFGEALAEALESGRQDPGLHLARVLQAAALEREGRLAEAGAALVAARRLRVRLTLVEIAQTHGRRVGERLAPLWAEGV